MIYLTVPEEMEANIGCDLRQHQKD